MPRDEFNVENTLPTAGPIIAKIATMHRGIKIKIIGDTAATMALIVVKPCTALRQRVNRRR